MDKGWDTVFKHLIKSLHPFKDEVIAVAISESEYCTQKESHSGQWRHPNSTNVKIAEL